MRFRSPHLLALLATAITASTAAWYFRDDSVKPGPSPEISRSLSAVPHPSELPAEYPADGSSAEQVGLSPAQNFCCTECHHASSLRSKRAVP